MIPQPVQRVPSGILSVENEQSPTIPGVDFDATSVRPGATPSSEDLDDALYPGQLVGRYVIVQVIAYGGMGAVYLAFDPPLDRHVALKLVRTDEWYEDDPERMHRILLNEARAMAKLDHPNIVQIYDIGAFDGRLFLAMEMIGGQSFRSWLDGEGAGLDAPLDLLIQVGRGLAAVHDAGMVHCDFKPGNFVVTEDGRALLLDFGLVSRDRSDYPQLSGSRPRKEVIDTWESVEGSQSVEIEDQPEIFVAGTPSYMAPEQHRGHSPDAKSDQYSFCTVLFEALVGSRPFEGRNPERLLRAKCAGLSRTDARIRRLPGWMRRVLRRGLSPDPHDRFADMHELLAALEHGRSGQAQRHQQWLGAVGIGLMILGFLAALWSAA